jgi:hypothetical protein
MSSYNRYLCMVNGHSWHDVYSFARIERQCAYCGLRQRWDNLRCEWRSAGQPTYLGEPTTDYFVSGKGGL